MQATLDGDMIHKFLDGVLQTPGERAQSADAPLPRRRRTNPRKKTAKPVSVTDLPITFSANPSSDLGNHRTRVWWFAVKEYPRKRQQQGCHGPHLLEQ